MRKPDKTDLTMTNSRQATYQRHPQRQEQFLTEHMITQPPDGGAGRDRTDDILLAKQALSQLSYGPDPLTPDGGSHEKWWAWEDLNLRPHAYQARALTN